ncbi:hypothetical protein BGW80DRAFT_1457418 [Lactifluus volemus]|nr:hypothetical protein BGW80DRAFT_1457418 [Lactifluus volemus]
MSRSSTIHTIIPTVPSLAAHKPRHSWIPFCPCFTDVKIAIEVESPVSFDPYDMRQPYPDSFPTQNSSRTSSLRTSWMLLRGPRSGYHSSVDDADWFCNPVGVGECASKLEFSDSDAFNSQPLQPYTVDGVEYGKFKTASKLSFLEVYEAGLMIPAYQPIVALQAFMQTMAQESLMSA